MVWSEQLYLGINCDKNLNKLKRRISRRKPHTLVYLIVLPEREGATLEIIPSVFLLQKSYPLEDLVVIGMALTKWEAMKIVEKILGEVYNRRGDLDVAADMRARRTRGAGIC